MSFPRKEQSATSWEIWQYDGPLRAKIEHVFRYASDEQACKQRYAELEEKAAREGGTYELRKDGVYLSMFSQVKPK